LSRAKIFYRQAEKSCPELATLRRRGHPEAEVEERLTESLDSISTDWSGAWQRRKESQRPAVMH
jgi:hypothetical protein